MNTYRWMHNKWVRMVQHLLFWALSFAVLLRLFGIGEEIQKVDILYTGLFHVLLLPAVYINLEVFLYQLHTRLGWFKYAVKLSLLVLVFSYINYRFFQQWSVLLFPDYYFISYYTWEEVALIYLCYITLTTLIKGARSWFSMWQLKSQLQETEKQKVQMELMALKSQLNPHFLFNTLNGIYSMALVRDERLPQTVLHLSDLMRYFLYEAKDDFVPLQKEMALLDTYINLQRIRMAGRLKLVIDITGEVTDQRIAPLLLITFFENAFKHGDRKDADEVFLKAALNVSGTSLSFRLQNRKGVVDEVEWGEFRGIGLPNIKRRLELLYPGRHTLHIENGETEFLVLLQLELHDH